MIYQYQKTLSTDKTGLYGSSFFDVSKACELELIRNRIAIWIGGIQGCGSGCFILTPLLGPLLFYRYNFRIQPPDTKAGTQAVFLLRPIVGLKPIPVLFYGELSFLRLIFTLVRKPASS